MLTSKITLLVLIFLAVSITMASNACAKQKSYYVEGVLFGHPLHVRVDHKLAATMLTNRQDSSVAKSLASYRNAELSSELLEDITRKYSLNVSTLFFAERLYGQGKNRQLQDYYLSAIDTLPMAEVDRLLSSLQDFHVVFVPAFNYESNTGSFLQQRELLDAARISNEIVKVQPWGLVADNAKMIAQRLQEISRQRSNIIIVSASKGSLETAIALGEILKPDELGAVKGWINACGILKGSPAADYWAVPLRRYWLSCGLFFVGKQPNLTQLLGDLSYNRRKQDAQTLVIPASVYTINLIAVGLGKRKDRTKMLVPNDGYSPLLDEIVGGGDVVMEVGSNHTFANVDLNIRLVALLRYLVGWQQSNK
jgi:hypothetical protein